jgi:hypothetical protein
MHLKRVYLTLLILLSGIYYADAQNSAPKISGNVSISMKDGLIKADLQLTNLPALDTN